MFAGTERVFKKYCFLYSKLCVLYNCAGNMRVFVMHNHRSCMYLYIHPHILMFGHSLRGNGNKM